MANRVETPDLTAWPALITDHSPAALNKPLASGIERLAHGVAPW